VMVVGVPAAAQTVQTPGGFVPRQAVSYGAAGETAVAVDEGHPLPTAPRGRAVTYADRSGTVAVAGVAQQLAPANAARSGLLIQNLSAGDLWLSTAGAATAGQPSFRIGAGQLLEFPASGVPAGAISVLGASDGQAFSAREW
jgi:hypothetical protein